MSSSVLVRYSHSSLPWVGLTPLQTQVDGLVNRFVEEAANPITLAALTAGGMAYRWGRIAVQGSGLGVRGGMLFPRLVRAGSIGFGLGAEVSAFELTSRSLLSLTPNPELLTPNLWNWSGPGGWAQGLASSAITFGMLKGGGFLAREQNLVLQHAFQSTAMVSGHQFGGALGIIPMPEGSLADQFLHAEVTNLQLAAGTGLVHAMAPGVHAFERGLDLSIRSQQIRARQASPLQGLFSTFATADVGIIGAPLSAPPSRDSRRNSHLILMSSTQGGGGDEGSKPPPIGGIRGEFYTRPEPEEGSSRKSSTEIVRHSLEMTWGQLIRMYPHGLGIFRLSKKENVFRLVMANERLGEMFGYSYEEASDMILRDFIHPEDVEQFSGTFSRLPFPEKIEGVRIRKKDGTFLYCDVKVGIGEVDNHHLIFTFIEDVTEKRRAEETLRQVSEVVDNSPNLVGVATPDGRIIYVNKAVKRMAGIPPEVDFSTLPPLHIRDIHPPEIWELIETIGFPTARGKGQWEEKTELLLPDGRRVPVHQIILAHKTSSGELAFFSTILRDLTDERKAQEALLETLLSQEQLRMAEMLAKGVAHDISNPLTYISNYIPVLIEHMEKSPEWASSAELNIMRNIKRQVDRIGETVKDFKDLSGRPELGNPFEIHSVLQERDIRDILGEDWQGQLEIRLSPQNFRTNMTPKKFNRVIQNLVTNARKAMADRDLQKLTIETALEDLGPQAVSGLRRATSEAALKASRYIRVTVSDTGKGIDEETQRHIFEPYFTTGDHTVNMGMGLALTRKFVQDVGGFIVVKSAVNRGTTFHIYLPDTDFSPENPTPTP